MSRRLVLGLVVALAVAAVVLAVVLPGLGDDEAPEGNAREPVLEGIEVVEGTQATTHVVEPVDYDRSPPVGGKHWAAWMDCGFYSEPVPDEFAVHNLEHGAVWVAYDPAALDDDQLGVIADELPDNGIATPYEGLGSPLVLSAWGRQLQVETWDDPRVQEFVDTFESAATAPEYEVGCAGGITTDQVEAAKAQLGISGG